MIGRALMFLIAPMTAVMFPKIVQAAAKAERTDVLSQALGATALLAAGQRCSAPSSPLFLSKSCKGRNIWRRRRWCNGSPGVFYLLVSSVLVNNLMARERYAVVPWLVAVAAAYKGIALWMEPFHASHVRVIQTLGIYCSAVFHGVCVVHLEKAGGT